MLTAILGTLVIGLVVGAIAKFLMPGRDPGGCFDHHSARYCRRVCGRISGASHRLVRARSTSRLYRFDNWRDVAFAYLSADSRSANALIGPVAVVCDRELFLSLRPR